MPDPPNRTDPTVHLPQIDGALLEIRAAEGGLDAGVWAFDLLQMYRAFAERQGWQPAVWQLRNWGGATSVAVSAVAEVVIALESEDAYLRLYWESGEHRVQRPPVLGAGRVHTSTALVTVLPRVQETEVAIIDEDVQEDLVEQPTGDLEHPPEVSVRLRHLPSGLVITWQMKPWQVTSKARAREVLRSRLFELKRLQHMGSARQAQKIRTYNFRENRVTDHRLGLSLYSLDRIVRGELDDLLDAVAKGAEPTR